MGHLSGYFEDICPSFVGTFVTTFVTTDYMVMEITKFLILAKNQVDEGKEPHKIRALSVCIHFVSILYTDLYTSCIHSIV